MERDREYKEVTDGTDDIDDRDDTVSVPLLRPNHHRLDIEEMVSLAALTIEDLGGVTPWCAYARAWPEPGFEVEEAVVRVDVDLLSSPVGTAGTCFGDEE